MMRAHTARGWATADGVIDSFYRDDQIQGGRGLLLAGPTNPTVEFSYDVNGHRYRGTRYRYGPDKYYGREPLPDYRQGDPVKVHYDPRRPWRSVLLTGVQATSILHLIFAIMLVMFGLAPLLV